MLKKVTIMSPFSPKTARSYNVRSISFPARSHPNMSRLEEELKKPSFLETTKPEDNIGARLSSLGEVYTCIVDLLDLQLTQQALAQKEGEKCVNEMLDCLIKYLDLCNNTRDAVLVMKENVRELQSALRRSKGGVGGDFSIESNVNAYISSRKKMKKDVTKCMTSLKQVDNISEEQLGLLDPEHYLSAIVRVLNEASLITTSIFTSLLLFLSAPVNKSKSSRWKLVSKLVHKGVVGCEAQAEDMKGLKSVDVAVKNVLINSCSEDGLEAHKSEFALEKLQVLDGIMEDIENELESLFRRLIQTRVSLLNVYTFSH